MRLNSAVLELCRRMSRAMLRNPLPSADAFLRKRLDASLEDMLGDLPNVNFAEQVKQPLKGLRVAPYYGCLIVRPFYEGNPEYPMHMDELLKVLGATRRRVMGTLLLEYGFLGLFTALVAAVSPALVYFSRFFIQETLLVISDGSSAACSSASTSPRTSAGTRSNTPTTSSGRAASPGPLSGLHTASANSTSRACSASSASRMTSRYQRE